MGDLPGLDSFVSFLPPRAWEAVAAAGVSRRYPAGKSLILQGDPTDHVLVITAGWVRVSATDPDGHETLLALRGPGDIVGDAAAFTGEPRAASITTLQEVDVLQLRQQDFHTVFTREPAVATALIRTLYAREQESEEARRNLAALDVSGRIARYLVRLAERHGQPGPDGVVLAVALTQQDLANHTAASLRAVARALAGFRDRGVIRTGRRRVIIQRLDVLRDWARLDLEGQGAG